MAKVFTARDDAVSGNNGGTGSGRATHRHLGLPRTVGCPNCGAEHSVEFTPIDLDAEPPTVETHIYGEDDEPVGVFQGINPRHYPTHNDYSDGVIYGEPAECSECGRITQPALAHESAVGRQLPKREAPGGVRIVSIPPPNREA